MSELLGAWAQSNPMAAANYAAQLPPGEIQNQAVRSVVSSSAGQNPEQTAAWVVQFPGAELRNQGISEVVSAWNNLDPDGVQNWALNLPAGTIRDVALKNLAENMTPSTPEQAARIIALIGDSVRAGSSHGTPHAVMGGHRPTIGSRLAGSLERRRKTKNAVSVIPTRQLTIAFQTPSASRRRNKCDCMFCVTSSFFLLEDHSPR